MNENIQTEREREMCDERDRNRDLDIVREAGGERERERERERETDRQTDRQTDIDTHTDTHTDCLLPNSTHLSLQQQSILYSK